MAPVEGRNVRSILLTSCLALIFGLTLPVKFSKIKVHFVFEELAVF